jgi:uncharacterized protein (DUF427 family)
MDTLYSRLLVEPYKGLAHWWRHEPVDAGVRLIMWMISRSHWTVAATQNGQLARYVAVMVLGLILMLALVVRSTT